MSFLEPNFIDEMLVSDLVEAHRGLEESAEPDPDLGALRFRPVCIPEDGTPHTPGHNFIDAGNVIGGRGGLIYFVVDIEVGPWDPVDVRLGYDGPVRVWWNGQEVFAGPGISPAVQDATSLRLESGHGRNRLTVALDTSNGEARGIYARWERIWESYNPHFRPWCSDDQVTCQRLAHQCCGTINPKEGREPCSMKVSSFNSRSSAY